MALTIQDTVVLNDGARMPRFGLGTYKSAPGGEARRAVAFALKHGYRSVDTASLYANERDVGAGIRDSGLAREDVFITTKVWNDEQGYECTLEALERSLRELGVDYVDLYLVHWPMRRHLRDTWRAMEELQQAGKARSIGVCNFLPHHLERLFEVADVPPAVDQVEFHPRLQQPDLQRYLAQHDIVLEAWAPIMRGRVAQVPEIVRIAERHGVSPAQVAIRWVLELGHVVIPKSGHEERILENADVFGFELAADEMDALAALDAGERIGPDPDRFAWDAVSACDARRGRT